LFVPVAVQPVAPPVAAPVVAAAPQRPSMVQIMAISHQEDADAIVNALKRHGYDVAVSQDPRDTLLHLQVGPFASRSDAEAMRQRLLVEGYNATIR
jgi:cell division septation protein DedD